MIFPTYLLNKCIFFNNLFRITYILLGVTELFSQIEIVSCFLGIMGKIKSKGRADIFSRKIYGNLAISADKTKIKN